MIQLLVATQNNKKLIEIKQILKGLKIKLVSLADIGLDPKIKENGVTFKENAAKKAVQAARLSGMLTLGEDSGICVKALAGRPGVRSARFSGKDKSDEKNNRKLLRLLRNVALPKRCAHYSCAVALASPKGLIAVVQGRCYGVIALKCTGNNGFGYDPLFLVPKYNKTFGQLSSRVKHSMSHRFRALKKARHVLEKYIEKSRRN